MAQEGLRDQPHGAQPTVLVTGGSGGIGRAICRAFGRAGWWVAVHYRQREREAARTLDLVREAGSDGTLYQADVCSLEAVQVMVQDLVKRRDTLETLVCNAGVAMSHLVLRHPESDWMRVIETNLTGTFHSLKAGATAMVERGGGSIVVIGSYAGLHGSPGQAAYAASKAGLVGLVKSAAREWGTHNIRVNLVCPGWQETRLAEGAIPHGGDPADHVLGRHSNLEAVAQTIYHLARLQDVSGQVWNLDSRIV